MSILLDVRCKRHPRYNAVQYPRRTGGWTSTAGDFSRRCETCVELWKLKRNLHGGITTLTSGAN